MVRRVLRWGIILAAGVFAIFVSASYLLLKPDRLKATLIAGIAEHFNLEAEVDELSVSIWPRPRVTGRRLVLRVPSRPDLPPFITIDRFTAGAGPLAILRKHVDTVHVDGLKIVVPPAGAREVSSRNAEEASRVIVDHLVAHNALLTFAPRTNRPPLTFNVHSLEVRDVGFGLPMPFTVALTNPVPTGLVNAAGTVGPWRTDDATLTAVVGEFTFTDADLRTINGIGGQLKSAGTFRGHLRAIGVSGEASVPDFSLDLGGRPVQLSSSFEVVVDGTDGQVELKRVDAKLAATSMLVSGMIANLPGPGRRDVQLTVRIREGRLEDLLALAIDAPQPVMTGLVALDTELALPPGAGRVRDRIKLSGRFALSQARFTDTDVQQKIRDMSRRSQGKSEEQMVHPTLTNLRSDFALNASRLSLNGLEFEVPGAIVALDGTYNLASAEFNLHGNLRMQASASQAMGGVKSIFIKPFNSIFRKDGAGAVLPIRITGPRSAPKFAIDFGKVFQRRGK